MKVWIDGRVVDENEAVVSAFDHGLTVGDGVFETLKVEGGLPFALTRHLARLQRSARGLGLPVPDAEEVRHAVAEALGANSEHLHQPMRLRITLTGGPAPLGSERGPGRRTLVVALATLAGWAPSAKVVLVPWVRNERSAVAGLKTTSYADNVVALSHARERGASEALFGNTRGELCEGTGSNVFVVVDGAVLTPPLSSGCLAGVTRELLLEWTEAQERDLPLAVLDQADEVFLASSTRDVQPVHAVGERDLPGVEGDLTRRVAETFAVRAAEQVDP